MSVRLKKEVVDFLIMNIIPLLGQCDKKTCKHTLSNVEWLCYMNMRVGLVLLVSMDLCMAHLGMGCWENKLRH